MPVASQKKKALSDRTKLGRNGYQTGMLSSRPDAHAIKVLIVEVGYLSELRYKEKLQAKFVTYMAPEITASSRRNTGLGWPLQSWTNTNNTCKL